MNTTETKIGCENCLYAGTHEKCDRSEVGERRSDCLGSCAEVESNNGKYLYRNFEAGDGIARIMQWENEGKRNIVIGGIGEAECNTNWTFKQTVKQLNYVSEQCGYLSSGNKEGTEIALCNHDGQFKLIFVNDRLSRIERVFNKDGQVITRTIRTI